MRTTKHILGLAIAAGLVFAASDAFARGWTQKSMPWAQKNASFAKGSFTGSFKGCMVRLANRNSSFTVVDPTTLSGQERGVYDAMVSALRSGVTPGLGLSLDDPGKGTRAGVAQSGGNSGSGSWTKITLSNFKGNTLSGTLFCPTSAHGGLNPVQLAKDQRHTLWINHGTRNDKPGSGHALVPGQQTNTKWDQGLVTVVRVEGMPVKKGTNYLQYDPYPGKTAGVGGFPEGRIIQFDVQ